MCAVYYCRRRVLGAVYGLDLSAPYDLRDIEIVFDDPDVTVVARVVAHLKNPNPV